MKGRLGSVFNQINQKRGGKPPYHKEHSPSNRPSAGRQAGRQADGKTGRERHVLYTIQAMLTELMIGRQTGTYVVMYIAGTDRRTPTSISTPHA